MSVAEVRYLYAYPNGGIAQPHYFEEVRSDVRTEHCTILQLNPKPDGNFTV